MLLPEVNQVNLTRLNCIQPNSLCEEGNDHNNGADKKQRTFE